MHFLFCLIKINNYLCWAMETKTKFVKYLRVSTKKQGSSGLGLAAQSDVVDYFIRDGELVATYQEVYTGTDLKNCAELQKAITFCKENNAKLIMYKSDRFRNVDDALAVMAELGEGNLVCCDLPSADRFTFILLFAIAEREALLISLRTKQALQKIKDEIKEHGYYTSRRGNAIQNLGHKKGEAHIEEAQLASAEARKNIVSNNQDRRRQWLLIKDLRSRGDSLEAIVSTLNVTGEKTPKGGTWSKGQVSAALNSWGRFFENSKVEINIEVDV